MTATKHTTLWCDFVGPHHSDRPYLYLTQNERCVEWTDHGHSKAAETRRLARREGWAAVGGKDYCPRHAEEGT